jgi:hypothetical protein
MRRSSFPLIPLLAIACGGNSGSGAPAPLREAKCAPGQTAFAEVSNELDRGVNIYAFISTSQSGQFVGIARPGKTTLQMPDGATRVYVAGLTATDTPIKRTSIDAALRFEYRCE